MYVWETKIILVNSEVALNGALEGNFQGWEPFHVGEVLDIKQDDRLSIKSVLCYKVWLKRSKSE